ncbi:MAG: cadmium-translocating P-type ATPase [Geminicoccaceae bacterium]|nr:cadmium-translocating P-type ATPase [Geminicoccaceae bacterium]MCB9943086.1 cadmium-translocating P-type ATPase [Geminicoccaceae bacterium]
MATVIPRAVDPKPFIQSTEGKTAHRLHLMVEGVHCGGCVRKIEKALSGLPGVDQARVNLTTRRLTVGWHGDPAIGQRVTETVRDLGYGAVPFDPERLGAIDQSHEKYLLRCLAVAGFAASNVMLLAVSVWAGHFEGMGEATRAFLHWFEALVTLPAVAYAGRPFFRSAISVLRNGHTNMDVPISLALLLACGMSLLETVTGGEHVYFDSAVTLLFFLLVGRYLDTRARGSARAAAQRLLAIGAKAVTRIAADGSTQAVRSEDLVKGDRILIATGERIGADGVLLSGHAELDMSTISGESAPLGIVSGERMFAGTINLGAAVEMRVTSAGEGTLLAEIVRMMEMAEQKRGRFVSLADRVAGFYAPAVHSLAAVAFLYWWLIGGLGWQESLLIAVAVLVVTCPCALGLAVPAVQVVASGRLMRQGILLKSATALERLADIDRVVFDKTGTLTEGVLELERPVDDEALRIAAGMAANSTHPLARAVAAACPDAPRLKPVREIAGSGLVHDDVRLGRAGFAGPDVEGGDEPELWLDRPGHEPVRFVFSDRVRDDAALVVDALAGRGLGVAMLSGDREPVAAAVAREVGIGDYEARCTPADKVRALQDEADAGHRVMMVGDGLNDAPALAAAHVSVSPTSAADISQMAADVVFQGRHLSPIMELLGVARSSRRLVLQNLVMAFGYNAITIPLAMAGYVTPLLAAIAMSTSSIVVVSNALRLSRISIH